MFFHTNDLLKPIVSTEPFQILVMDHCGPFGNKATPKGNKFILTIVDHFSRKRWFIPVPDVTAETSVQALLDNVFTPFEFPETVLSDLGSGFDSVVSKEMAKFFPYKVNFALKEQHNTVGSAEISNQIIENYLTKFIDQSNHQNWDDFVRIAAYALNKSLTVHGYSPDFLIFGRDPINPYIPDDKEYITPEQFVAERKKALDLAVKLANETLADYRKKMEDKNLKIRRNFTKFKKNQWVYLQKPLDAVEHGLSRKLSTKSLGPYKVIEVDTSKGNVTLQIAPNQKLIVKNNQIRLSAVQDIHEEPDKLIPSKLNEILILTSISEIEKLKNQSTKGLEKNKKKIQIPEGLVGRRIEVTWPSGTYKGKHKATVIGYTANKNANLVFYDSPDINCDRRTNYYAHDLRVDAARHTQWRFL
jgi:hypothetical protein